MVGTLTTGLFGNILMMAQTRQLYMKEILKVPCHTLLLQLMVYLGKQRSPHYPGNYKRMFHHLNSSLCHLHACIVDGMEIVHKVKG